MSTESDNFPAALSLLLESRLPRQLQMEHLGRAAVLMPIFRQQSEHFFLLTQRTHTVETHKGQISFPGGLRESESEPLLQTALRETWEEIGLGADKVRVMGQFDDYPSVTRLIVTPFVGWIEYPFELKPNPSEVAELLFVPFSLFRDPANLRVETQMRLDRQVEVYFYSYEGREVWGLTARMIRDFLSFVDAHLTKN